jgi:hypothetical protein
MLAYMVFLHLLQLISLYRLSYQLLYNLYIYAAQTVILRTYVYVLQFMHVDIAY